MSHGIDLRNHFCLKNTEQLKTINKPLEFIGLDAFCYTSIDLKTSERFVLTDHPAWTHRAYNSDFYENSLVKKIETSDSIQTFLWQDFSHNAHFENALQAAKAHGLRHGITLVYYTEDRANMYYASTNKILPSDEVLLGIKDQLVDFLPYFHHCAKELIAESEKHQFIVRKNQGMHENEVSPAKLKSFYDAIEIKQLVINSNGDYLTHQETLCVYLAISGKTMKSISEKLHISARTVEKHIANARRKLNIATHESLLGKLFDSLYFTHVMRYGKRFVSV